MSEKKRPRVMVDMSATLIHHGHIRLLKKASEIGDVVVALTTDDEIKQKKGYTPELNFEERKEILESIKYVSEVVPSPWLISFDYMKEHHCDLLVHGALHAQGWDHETDEEAELMEQKERQIMNELGFDDPYYDAARGH